jgi:hypothetical protein
MATAQLYIRRFYTKVEIRKTNPYLVIATAVYLACKMEECPHHIRLVVSEGRALWPGRLQSSLQESYVLTMPFRFFQQRYLEAWGV